MAQQTMTGRAGVARPSAGDAARWSGRAAHGSGCRARTARSSPRPGPQTTAPGAPVQVAGAGRAAGKNRPQAGTTTRSKVWSTGQSSFAGIARIRSWGRRSAFQLSGLSALPPDSGSPRHFVRSSSLDHLADALSGCMASLTHPRAESPAYMGPNVAENTAACCGKWTFTSGHLPDGPEGVMSARGAVCVCGHSRENHEHYRRGSDCSSCGCRQYRKRSWVGRVLNVSRRPMRILHGRLEDDGYPTTPRNTARRAAS